MHFVFSGCDVAHRPVNGEGLQRRNLVPSNCSIVYLG